MTRRDLIASCLLILMLGAGSIAWSEDISAKAEQSSSEDLNLEQDKLALERERFEFEKQLKTEKKGFLADNLGVVITACATILAAIIAKLITYAQIKTSNITKAKELELARLHNEAEDDRQWRLSFLDFLIKNRDDLFSNEPGTQTQAISLMDICFPSRYTTPFHNKFSLVSKEAPQTGEKSIRKKVLDDLLSPLYIQFERSRAAFTRWTSKNLYLEANVIRQANLHIRDLLIDKASLIPAHLRSDAVRLVEHYDAWLEEFDRVRGGIEPDHDKAFVFVGPKGIPFPRESERRFIETYEEYMREIGNQVVPAE